jgi:hypothetical protein
MLQAKNASQELTKVFKNLLEEYVISALGSSPDEDDDSIGSSLKKQYKPKEPLPDQEQKLISDFLAKPCRCGKNCRIQFTAEELFDSRADFRSFSWDERNCAILCQLRSFQKISKQAKSGRSIKDRERQKFDYRINADRPVCRDVFLFYHGETLKRLKHLQKHFIEAGTSLPTHGNAGRKPKHACSPEEKQYVNDFIVNFAAMHGLPDPGRDLRKGKGKLRILLPAVLNYRAVHRVYQKSMLGMSTNIVGYRTFVRIWQEVASHICFSKPRSDLCMTCENFKKALNRIASDLSEDREDEKIQVHQQAIEHLENAKKERDYYRHCIKLAEESYLELDHKQRRTPCKPNSSCISMHYSWDFAQQLHYPYEDQQVGPIYFKTPRRAHLFGVCCEGIPSQVNYLIDEADFLEKNSNIVISLLDHFFENYALGETHAYLTADNSVAQNKNNALLHYLLYRTLVGLHDRITLSFMLVGHTKFAPDGYFGLIKYRYRRSRVYTYEQLADIIEKSSEKGHNLCQRYRDETGAPDFEYRDWSNWLSQYFKKLPNITRYHHFILDCKESGVVTVKKAIDAPEEKFMLLKAKFPYSPNKRPIRLPRKMEPPGLSAERSWYLYDGIREHIPAIQDKDATCPRPNVARPVRE